MIRQTETSHLRPVALVSIIGLLLLPGCSQAPNQAGGDPGTRDGIAPGRAPLAVAPTNQLKLVAETELVAITNQFAAVQQVQSELIQKLLNRIDQLERKDAEQHASTLATREAHEVQIKVYEERARNFDKQISDLETRVTSLQSGQVLPEIALTPDDSPTTRELDQKIRIAERKNELEAEVAATKAKESPKLTVGASGFSFSSADTNFTLKLRGLIQLDSRTFIDDNPLSEGNDTFALRRARPIIEGTVFRDFDFQFVPDFGGSSVQLFDANLNYRYRPELQFKAGKFKGPVGLENLQSDSTLPFNERGLVSNFMPVRNVGVSLWGDVGDGMFSYSIGAFNVAGDGRNPGTSDFGDDKEFAGRLFVHPFKSKSIPALQGFGFGLGGSYSQVSSNANGLPGTTGGTRSGYVTSGLQQFFAYNPVNGTVVADGAQWRLSPQLSYLWGPFGLLSEYAISHQTVVNGFNLRKDSLDHTAWQISAQWVLSGEPASFTGINPSRPFGFGSGGWGAWQLVGRYGKLHIDDDTFPIFANPATSANSATSWAVGVNWWLNKNVRLMTSFSHTSFDGGGEFNPLDASTYSPPATVTAQDENAFLTRIQLSF